MIQVIGVDHAHVLARRLTQGAKAWLFLDYDGTLADFAPTPDIILPDPEVIALIERLSRFPQVLRLIVLSGRMVSQIQKLLPVPGILLAGTYGVEYRNWDGEEVHLLDLSSFRPHLDRVKRGWEEAIHGHPGFFLEDKGYTIALHAKNALPQEASKVMPAAHRIAQEAGLPDTLRISDGDMFLEVSHMEATKGRSVDLLLDRFPWPKAEIIYVGDSEQDEPAFEAVRRHGGTPILVSQKSRETHALYCMGSPVEVRRWLAALADGLENQQGGR